MDIGRKLGILVFCGVPAIVGGGILWWLTGGDYTIVAIYEAILLLLAGGLVCK